MSGTNPTSVLLGGQSNCPLNFWLVRYAGFDWMIIPGSQCEYRQPSDSAARKAAITTSALSTFEKSVYAAGNDGVCLDLRQVLADEVAQSMTGRHFQKELTA
jgi:hypothetical protein